MKKTIVLLTSASILLFAACNSATKSESTEESSQNFALDTASVQTGTMYYQCPMDAEVISDKAGACPKCGMNLEAKTKQ